MSNTMDAKLSLEFSLHPPSSFIPFRTYLNSCYHLVSNTKKVRARQTSVLERLKGLGHLSEDRRGYEYNHVFLTDIKSYEIVQLKLAGYFDYP
jgi:hypothetical protein